MTSNFKLTFVMKRKDTGTPIYHKQDGERFEQTHTVKLNVSTLYNVGVTVRPVLHLQRLLIQGEAHKVEVEENKTENEDDSRTYVTEYDTSVYDVTKRAKRREIPFTFEFSNGAYMKLTLQCKLYPASETDHCHWGTPLNVIDCDCQLQEGHNFVRIDRQKYL